MGIIDPIVSEDKQETQNLFAPTERRRITNAYAHRYIVEPWKWKIHPLYSVEKNSNGEWECNCGFRGSCGSPGKHPVLDGWETAASDDPAKIDEWFPLEGPIRNIGLACGERSGVTVYDIDSVGFNPDGSPKVGAETWMEAIRDHGEPVTLMAKTGSGGMHVFFKYCPTIKTTVNFPGKNVDTRNNGGNLVLPPSVHVTGGVYEWI